MRTIKINKDYYEIKKNLDYEYNWKDLYDLYGRPSDYKKEIYKEREQKLYKIDGLTGNRFYFTIYGQVKDKKNNLHLVRITANHNYILDDWTLTEDEL